VHPDYKAAMSEYLERALRNARAAHAICSIRLMLASALSEDGLMQG
jgi:acyl-CoA hydrolase